MNAPRIVSVITVADVVADMDEVEDAECIEWLAPHLDKVVATIKLGNLKPNADGTLDLPMTVERGDFYD